ncbi:DNA-directed RNA polymerases IV and V subunit 4 isoform X1 [Cinnamomum micranthum f. kanehirae]|uniref:DNA-directed RNA polymerases IV and V subunit 4 isoform X1 n=1 Tax=Cinnamomum micranthum f. kanehirae TaxID=337451 RepID=A0A443PW79_9MAGN|nr:DNA-directed RNA polymerases IV and V subunit 4 isoform X1 [Cinnamomum micranthum f. kanehirae]
MSEKGEKRFTVPSGKKTTASKSIAKKDASSKGKDGSSAKVTKLQLDSSDSEGSPRSSSKISSKAGGKVSFKTPVATKEDWGKGGKDDQMGKSGGKGGSVREPVVKVVAEVELKVEEELPKNSKCLMDCEAAVILQGVQEQLGILCQDPAIKIPESFSKGLEYAKTGSHYTDPKSLKQCKVSDGEICQIGNSFPETVDEVFALVPSLKANRTRNEGPIKDVLSELAKFKTAKSGFNMSGTLAIEKKKERRNLLYFDRI